MRRNLPQSLADVRGLRAARWVRESRKDQLTGTGPDDQRFEQDQAIESLGLVDSGLEWIVGNSGWRKLDKHPAWREMIEKAGREYDVLIVGYVSRFCRNLTIGASMREQMHEQGATIYFCDDRILLSDDRDWNKWADLLVGAEYYSRDLSHKMSRTFATRFREHAEPGGMAPLGFRRVGPDKATRLEIDPDTIEQVVRLFERFALGKTTKVLADETGLHEERIKPIIRNRIYNGYVQRYGEWVEAAWRENPPVSDELWERVTDLRMARSRGGGPRRTDRVDLLNGLLWCVCGQKLWSEPTGEKYRKRHRSPCGDWGMTERLLASTWEVPIIAQVSQLDLSPRTIARVSSALTAPHCKTIWHPCGSSGNGASWRSNIRRDD